MAFDNLFTSYPMSSDLVLKNRIVMAPMTRCFADGDLVPTKDMADYYSKRAGAGLIITEATLISADGQGYPNTPGIYNQKQVAGWKKVVDAVHKSGGKIFSQLWHTGRLSHSYYTSRQPAAPSAISFTGAVPRSQGLVYEMPRPFEKNEIKELVQMYASAAANAMEAGFDGVEIHGANGYLIDQFLRQGTNQRQDEYGGSVENRVRFPLEVVDAVINEVGAGKTAIRLSPQAYINLEYTEGDEQAHELMLKELDNRNILYVHLGAFDSNIEYDYLQGKPAEYISRHFNGTIINCGGFNLEKAQKVVEDKEKNLIAIGRPFIANPDLIERAQTGKALNDFEDSMMVSLS